MSIRCPQSKCFSGVLKNESFLLSVCPLLVVLFDISDRTGSQKGSQSSNKEVFTKADSSPPLQKQNVQFYCRY